MIMIEKNEAVICDSFLEKRSLFATARGYGEYKGWCEIVSGEPKLLEAQDARWLSKTELHGVSWLPADLGLIKLIEGEEKP